MQAREAESLLTNLRSRPSSARSSLAATLVRSNTVAGSRGDNSRRNSTRAVMGCSCWGGSSPGRSRHAGRRGKAEPADNSPPG